MEFPPGKLTKKWRKVRNGAYSCQECRRRKVKCTFIAPESARCAMCERRDSSCISQYEASGSNGADDAIDTAQIRNMAGDQSLYLAEEGANYGPRYINPRIDMQHGALASQSVTIEAPGSSSTEEVSPKA